MESALFCEGATASGQCRQSGSQEDQRAATIRNGNRPLLEARLRSSRRCGVNGAISCEAQTIHVVHPHVVIRANTREGCDRNIDNEVGFATATVRLIVKCVSWLASRVMYWPMEPETAPFEVRVALFIAQRRVPSAPMLLRTPPVNFAAAAV